MSVERGPRPDEPQIPEQAPDEKKVSEAEVLGLHQEKKEEERKYHFEMMASLEPLMVSLAKKLKEAVEGGEEYGGIISDDVGGRIPSLVLDKIFKRVLSEDPKSFKTYFWAAGRDTPISGKDSEFPTDRLNEENALWMEQAYGRTLKFLKSMDFDKNKKVLVVSQYLENGNSFKKMGVMLKDAGIENFDFASAVIDENDRDVRRDEIDADLPFTKKIKDEFRKKFDSNLYIGASKISREYGYSNWPDRHGDFSLVAKRKNKEGGEYLPYPQTIVSSGGRLDYMNMRMQEEMLGPNALGPKSKIDDAVKEKLELLRKRRSESLTEAEIKEINERVAMTREDADLMAERIIAKLWPEEK